MEFFVDGHQRLAFHLVVVVVQVGGAVGVEGDAVIAGPDRIGDPQAAADQDEGDELVGGVVPPVEVGRRLDLRHDLPGDCAGQRFGAAWVVLGEEHRRGRQVVGELELP